MLSKSRIIEEKNKINESIRQFTKFNETDEKTLCFLHRSPPDNFTRKQIEKLDAVISSRKAEIQTLEGKMSRVESGDYDAEFLEISRSNEKVIQEKNLKTLQVKLDEKEENIEADRQLQLTLKKDRKSDLVNKIWYYDNAEKFFQKSADTIPDYLKKELKFLPCNQGVVWKSVWYFGESTKAKAAGNCITESRKGYKVLTKWDKVSERVYERRNNVDTLIKKTFKKVTV